MNPDVVSAIALAIAAASGSAPTEIASPPLDARKRADRVQTAVKALRAVAPETGAYFNECDYFQHAWQRAFWGPHYPRLREIKERYDPEGLFIVHHGVGSERWSPDEFVRTD